MKKGSWTAIVSHLKSFFFQNSKNNNKLSVWKKESHHCNSPWETAARGKLSFTHNFPGEIFRFFRSVKTEHVAMSTGTRCHGNGTRCHGNGTRCHVNRKGLSNTKGDNLSAARISPRNSTLMALVTLMAVETLIKRWWWWWRWWNWGIRYSDSSNKTSMPILYHPRIKGGSIKTRQTILS